MSKAGSIKIKAAIFLLAFGLNTIVGFACSLGLDMGFNSKNHHQKNEGDHEETEAVVHIHADGKRHIHYEKKHDHSKAHDHDKKAKDQSKEEKENCCTDIVQKIDQADKSLPTSPSYVSPIFLIAFFDVFYDEALPSCTIVKDIKQFVRSYHPPIPDIRIAIRSFQI